MPFLALVHLRELRCAQCGEVLAVPGARSILVDDRGEAAHIPEEEAPEELTAVIVCLRGHETSLSVPDDVSAEEVLSTPDDAPLGRDARVRANVP